MQEHAALSYLLPQDLHYFLTQRSLSLGLHYRLTLFVGEAFSLMETSRPLNHPCPEERE